MAVFVSGPGFPFVLEFDNDGIDAVTDVFRDLIQNGLCVTFSFPSFNQLPATQVLINFALTQSLIIGVVEPDQQEGRPRLAPLTLANISWR